MERQATCSCGQLSVACRGEPAKVSVCHCRQCQKRTGSAYGIAAFFPRESLTISGPATAFTRASESGFPVTFHFCPACGSTVYWEPQRMPDLVAVAAGAFADTVVPRPTQQVHEETRQPWARVDI